MKRQTLFGLTAAILIFVTPVAAFADDSITEVITETNCVEVFDNEINEIKNDEIITNEISLENNEEVSEEISDLGG